MLHGNLGWLLLPMSLPLLILASILSWPLNCCNIAMRSDKYNIGELILDLCVFGISDPFFQVPPRSSMDAYPGVAAAIEERNNEETKKCCPASLDMLQSTDRRHRGEGGAQPEFSVMKD